MELKFKVSPLKFKNNALTVSLDTLNRELEQYQMKVETPDDIDIDQELSELNKATVVKIHAVDTEPGGDFNQDAFFDKSLEDKFEQLDFVYSAEVDKGDLVITLILNSAGVTLKNEMAKGGSVGDAVSQKNDEIESEVDKLIKSGTAHAFQEAGIAMPHSNGTAKQKKRAEKELQELIPQVKQKLIENRLSKVVEPVYVFFHGRKIDVRHGVSASSQYLADYIYNILYNKVIDKTDASYAKEYANVKTIFILDNIKGFAQEKKPRPYHLTDQELEEIIKTAMG